MIPAPPTARRFTFRDAWTVSAEPGRVQSVLADLERYPEWWPQVRAVAKVNDDEALVVCRSTLPYALDLHLTAVHRDPLRLEVAIDGDLVGSARWDLGPEDAGTRLRFHQDVAVAARPLALASYVARPLLRWNHHRMMAGCLRGLAARLAGAPGTRG